MISSGQWTYVLIKILINSNSHKENQIIQQLTTMILCNLSFLLFQTIQYAQFFCLKSPKNPINSYFQVLCAVIAHYTTEVSYKVKKTAGRVLSSGGPISGLFVNTISPFAVHGLTWQQTHLYVLLAQEFMNTLCSSFTGSHCQNNRSSTGNSITTGIYLCL